MHVRRTRPGRLTERGLLALALALLLLPGTACRRDSRSRGGGQNERAPDVAAPAGACQGRIISLSPSTTEILYGVGAFACVVAVSDYDDFPPEVKQLPHIGGWSNTNLEQVATLKPDLVVMTQSQAPLIKDKLDAFGIKSLAVPSYTVADALAAIEQIGRATGRTQAAQALVAQTRAKLDDVRTRSATLARPRVICIVDRVPGTLRGLYTASGGSFFVELIELAGGESVAPPAPNGFGQISKEAIVTLNPDIIIDMVQSAPASALAEDPQAVWQELAQVKAVRERRVYAVRETYVLHPSQFVGDTARRFAELLHPEVFQTGERQPQ